MNKDFRNFLSELDFESLMMNAFDAVKDDDGMLKSENIPLYSFKLSLSLLEKYHKWLFEQSD